MTTSNPQFRADFPEFSSSSDFPNSQIDYWLTVSALLMNVDRWKSLYNHGQSMFIAHHVSLEAKEMKEASVGGLPGQNSGPISSKSIGGVSVSYDVGSSIELNARHWNTTMYGRRFIRLARMVGAGPIQIGGGTSPCCSGVAWPGPWAGTIPSPSN